MTTENTTTQAPAATISEKELWAIFVHNPVQVTMGAGTVIERYKPDDMLRDTGCWGCMDEYASDLADGLLTVDAPEEELRRRIEEAEAYLAGIRSVYEDFRQVKASLLIDGEDDNERYHMPTMPAEAAAS